MEVEQFAKSSLVVYMIENIHRKLLDLAKENFRKNDELTSGGLAVYYKVLPGPGWCSSVD